MGKYIKSPVFAGQLFLKIHSIDKFYVAEKDSGSNSTLFGLLLH